MITEYEIEPVPGLPAPLPAGETMLWQGSPDRRALARSAFHTRLVALYFAGLTAIAIAAALWSGGGIVGPAMTAGLGVVGVSLLQLLAWATARSAIYTLTDRRIVLRIGIALPKCINLPLSLVSSIDLTEQGDGTGDVALAVNGAQRIGYAGLWPHARPWRVATPQPMLRGVRDAHLVGSMIAAACRALAADSNVVPLVPPAAGPTTRPVAVAAA